MDNKTMELDDELMQKARSCGSAEEILALAKENGMELTAAQAEEYFKMLSSATGELADEELNSVSGGCSTTVGKTEYTVVTSNCACFNGQYEKGYGGNPDDGYYLLSTTDLSNRWSWFRFTNTEFQCCGSCLNLKFNAWATGYCGKSGR